MDPFNSRNERLAIRTFCIGVAMVLALLTSLRLRAAEPVEDRIAALPEEDCGSR